MVSFPFNKPVETHMILSAEHNEQLLALDAYAITARMGSGQLGPIHNPEGHEWTGLELTVTVTISGYGDTLANATPTWQASATDTTLEAAFNRALQYAPAQLAECNARAAGRLHEVLPDFDPDGTRKGKTRRAPRPSGPKISAEQLADLLGDLGG